MATIGLIVHHARPEAAALARETSAWLVDRGHEVRLPDSDAEAADLKAHACSLDRFSEFLDLAVSLGGDGTMLRTVDLVADDDVPVLGVNLGHLGYLTEVEAAQLPDALERFLSGGHEVEQRMRLAIEVFSPTPSGLHGRWPALNEAVVGKTPTGQIVSLAVEVDGEHLTTYRADGLIVATPTGSTAYAWSAGGPIVAPSHAALLLTPVAPHMLFDRSLVLPPGATVQMQVVADRTASVSVDGRNLGLLEPGGTVTCTAAGSPARVVTFEPGSFLRILKAKFGLDGR